MLELGYITNITVRLRQIRSIDPKADPQSANGGNSSTSSGEKPCLRFLSEAAYRPDQWVADAWGFGLDDVVVEEDQVGELYHWVVSLVSLDRVRLDE